MKIYHAKLNVNWKTAAAQTAILIMSRNIDHPTPTNNDNEHSVVVFEQCTPGWLIMSMKWNQSGQHHIIVKKLAFICLPSSGSVWKLPVVSLWDDMYTVYSLSWTAESAEGLLAGPGYLNSGLVAIGKRPINWFHSLPIGLLKRTSRAAPLTKKQRCFKSSPIVC